MRANPATCFTAASISGQRARIALNRASSAVSRWPGRPVIQAVTCRTGGGRFRTTWATAGRIAAAPRLQVALEDGIAAGVALSNDLGVQRGGVAHPGGEPLVQVRLERVELAGPHAAGDQLLDTVGAQVAADGLDVQAEPAADHRRRQALHLQGADLQEPPSGALGPGGAQLIQRALGPAGSPEPCSPSIAARRRRAACGLDQAGVVRGDQRVHLLAQVVPQVPPVGHLPGVGCTLTGAVGVAAGPVPADHLHAGVGAQPVGEVLGVPGRPGCPPAGSRRPGQPAPCRSHGRVAPRIRRRQGPSPPRPAGRAGCGSGAAKWSG